jgi:hypothetical protein
MTRFRRALAVLTLGGASVVAWFGISGVVQNVQFARAAQEVELSRQQLQNLQDLSSVYRQVAKVVEPSVVKIDVRRTIRSNQMNMPDPDFLRRFFPDRDGDGEPDVPDEEMLQMGEGSGVIIEAGGGTAYVLTNNHVAGEANQISVTLADGREVHDWARLCLCEVHRRRAADKDCQEVIDGEPFHHGAGERVNSNEDCQAKRKREDTCPASNARPATFIRRCIT